MTSTGYTQTYYERLKDSASDSARVVVPLVMELLRPMSVVDVGCGSGEWTAEFKRHGMQNVLGIDGDYVDRNKLAISIDEFLAADLTQPLAIQRRFDLAISLEVAEHLPPRCARQFVTTLASLAPSVVFSAAIPDQGGEQHVNEQWPQYWTDLFNEHDFAAFDVLRPKVWSIPLVQWWYAQNMLLFVKESHVGKLADLQNFQPTSLTPALVHPRCLEHLAWKCRVRDALLELVNATHTDTNIVMVDESQLGDLPEIGRRIRPFNIVDGIDCGSPEDSITACQRLQRQIDDGANYMAIAWPSFWWLDHYVEFASHLRRVGREVLHTDNWMVYALN